MIDLLQYPTSHLPHFNISKSSESNQVICYESTKSEVPKPSSYSNNLYSHLHNLQLLRKGPFELLQCWFFLPSGVLTLRRILIAVSTTVYEEYILLKNFFQLLRRIKLIYVLSGNFVSINRYHLFDSSQTS